MSPRPVDASAVPALAARFREASAEDLIRWAGETFGDGLAIASSFSAEDVVLIDLAVRLAPRTTVFTLDTGRLPEETHAVIDAVRRRYGLAVEVHMPDAGKAEALVREKGMYSFRQGLEERRSCCFVRKVEPLRRALQGKGAWMTGLRNGQAATRHEVDRIAWDGLNGGLVKINPLASWTSERIWEHVRANGLPYNALYDKGYTSIGCAPCTRPVQPGEDERAGRWWWEDPDKKECGLHR